MAMVQNSVATSNRSRITKLMQLEKNMNTRMFFFFTENEIKQQFNKLQKAYNDILAFDFEVADDMWENAYQNTKRQFVQAGKPIPQYLAPGTTRSGFNVDYFKKGYVQPMYNAEVNNLYEADRGWETEDDEIYDGTNTLELMAEDELMGWQVSADLETHKEQMEASVAHPTCNKALFAAQLADKLAGGSEHVAYFKTIVGKQVFVTFEFALATYEVRKGLERLRHMGYQMEMDDPRLIDKLAEALTFFEKFSDSIDDPTELDTLRDAYQEERAFAQLAGAPKVDLTLNIEHNGWRMIRSASVGIGTPDPIQQFHQMKPEVFFAIIRNRANLPTFEKGFNIRLPRTSLTHLLKATQYAPYIPTQEEWDAHEEAGTAQPAHWYRYTNQPRVHVENFVKSICLAQWHDELYNTNYFNQAAERCVAAFANGVDRNGTEFLDSGHDLVMQARVPLFEAYDETLPKDQQCQTGRLDQFNINLFLKEMRKLEAHNWGPFHQKAY